MLLLLLAVADALPVLVLARLRFGVGAASAVNTGAAAPLATGAGLRSAGT